MKRVSTTRTFKVGEPIKLNIGANRDRCLCLINIGFTGKSHVLFPNLGVSSNFIRACAHFEIPYNTYMPFDESPGDDLTFSNAFS